MEGHQAQVTIRPAAWSDRIAELLAQAGPVALYQKQVDAGIAQAFRIDIDGQLVCAVLLRIEGREGVIVAAGGDGKGVNLTETMLPAIERLFQGVDTVRIHTARPGLAKVLAAQHGYQLQELVLSKKVNHGRS